MNIKIMLGCLFSFFSVALIKMLTSFIESLIKEHLKNHEKIINRVNDFYPLFTIGMSLLLAWIYPVFDKELFLNVTVRYILHILCYLAVIQLIYHFFYKPILNRVKNIIENERLRR